MANKRLNHKDLKDEIEEYVAAKKLRESLGTPKRCPVTSCSNLLSPITQLSLNMGGESMNLNADAEKVQGCFQSSSVRALSVFNNSLDVDDMALMDLEKYEEREESQRRSMQLFLSSEEKKHQEQGQGQGRNLFTGDLRPDPQLIGDLSKPCALPCLMAGTRHNDLKTISGDTLARLIQGEFVEQLGTGGGYEIIDCRYPYEFLGGHIQGARNLYTRDQIKEAFPSLTHKEEEAGRRIYVFHCEFSSERGPRLLRYLRNRDRVEHASSYPTLDYPELYLLHGGYKEFHSSHGDLCDPSDYVPMLTPAYKEELRICRAKNSIFAFRRQSIVGKGESEGEGEGDGQAPTLLKRRSLQFGQMGLGDLPDESRSK